MLFRSLIEAKNTRQHARPGGPVDSHGIKREQSKLSVL